MPSPGERFAMMSMKMALTRLLTWHYDHHHRHYHHHHADRHHRDHHQHHHHGWPGCWGSTGWLRVTRPTWASLRFDLLCVQSWLTTRMILIKSRYFQLDPNGVFVIKGGIWLRTEKRTWRILWLFHSFSSINRKYVSSHLILKYIVTSWLLYAWIQCNLNLVTGLVHFSI